MHASGYVVIPGSTRPNRRSPIIARWVATLGEQVAAAPFRVVDLRDVGLQLDDEPGIPAMHDYTRETTRAWGELISSAAGVVIVTPQYNRGYPAVLKNAIDHLYREWQGKPVLIVTYGGHGGGKCGEQLRSVMLGIGARVTDCAPALVLAEGMVAANDGCVDPEQTFASQADDVRAALRELAALVDG